MKVAIVRYNGGNIVSVANALSRLGADAIVTDSAEELSQADKVIFPGVGEASSAMESLRRAGLDRVIPALKQPVLGICLGMQLMCSYSEENQTTCLGILPQRVIRFPDGELKVPHIGWNSISELSAPIFEGVQAETYMYFVHSYYVELGEGTVATTEYDVTFSAAVSRNNFFGVQFHPEKSGPEGAQILKNFLAL